MFQRTLKYVLRELQGGFKDVPRVFQRGSKDESSEFQDVSIKFHTCFKEVSRKGISRMFQGMKSVLTEL